MSVIIMGNGPSVLNEKLGNKIDSFKTVIRLNRFSTEEFEYTGTKIDIWAVSKTFNVDIGKENFVDFSQKPAFLIKCGIQNPQNKRLRKLAGKHECAVYQYSEKYKEQIQKEIQAQRPGKETRPSTGLFITHYFLNYLQLNKVYIHGFDHLVFGKRTHYFSKETYPRHKHIHVEEIERAYFEKWEKEGRIVRLCNLGKKKK